MQSQIRVTETDGTKKVVGVYDSDTKIFTTKRNIGKHLFRKFNAYGLDKKLVLDYLVPWEATIHIIEIPSRKVYKISAKDFVKHGVPISYHQHREQLCVNREQFN